MDVRMQAQCFTCRQPRAPEAETRVVPPPLCLRCTERPPVLDLQTAQRCGEILQMPEGLPDVRPLGRRVRRRPCADLHDLMYGEGLRLDLQPEPARRRQGQRCGVQGPADAPLPAGDPPPKRLFLGKAEQRKTADLTKIPRQYLIRLRISRVAGCRRRCVVLHGGLFRGGSSQGEASVTNALQTWTCATVRWRVSRSSSALRPGSAPRASVAQQALLSLASGSCTALIRVCSL